MTEPTDAELDALWDENDLGPEAEVHRRFARAALAKFGMPSGAGEVVAWRHRMGPTDIWVECSKEFHDWVVREPSAWPRDEVQALCIATPQPTQAQAGAVPLTDEQVDAAAKKLAECMDYPWDHMPEQGRAEMRKHAQAVLSAANCRPPPPTA